MASPNLSVSGVFSPVNFGHVVLQLMKGRELFFAHRTYLTDVFPLPVAQVALHVTSEHKGLDGSTGMAAFLVQGTFIRLFGFRITEISLAKFPVTGSVNLI